MRFTLYLWACAVACASANVLKLTRVFSARADADAIKEALGNITSIKTHASFKNSNSTSLSPQATFSCSSQVTTLSWQRWYYNAFPWALARIDFTAEGEATCTIPMVSISYNLWAIDPEGGTHPVAEANCELCATLVAPDLAYQCVQGAQLTPCDGVWQFGIEVIFVVEPPYEFTTGTGGCVPEGVVSTCTATYAGGTVVPYNANLPPGVEEPPELTAGNLEDIHDYHFPGGSEVDNGKGLFREGTTDAQLEAVYENGLKETANGWTPSTTEPNYWLKTWPYTNSGVTSTGTQLNSMTMLISKWGDFVTMYPS